MRRVAVIVVVLAALAAGWYVHGRGDRPGSQRWVTGAGTDRRLDLQAVRGTTPPLRARHVDIMTLQVARQPEALRRYGAVVCKLQRDPLGKGSKPSPLSVHTVACERRSASLSIVATGPGPGLEHHPAAVARLVDQAYDRLR